MRYLLDTNVISESIKQIPNKGIKHWFESVDNDNLYISVITFGEIRKGIANLPDGKRKNDLTLWLEEDVNKVFLGRILPVNIDVADKWGVISGRNQHLAIDYLIAATCLVHNMTLVTRNVKDFQIPGLEIVNPFTEDNY
jgi:toxin FitB